MIWARFIYVHQLLFGAIIVTVVLFMPRGILGVLQQKYNLPGRYDAEWPSPHRSFRSLASPPPSCVSAHLR